jgi:hypothetical protein
MIRFAVILNSYYKIVREKEIEMENMMMDKLKL